VAKETDFISELRAEIFPCTVLLVQKVYNIPGSKFTHITPRTEGKAYAITPLETKKNLTRKAIDQLGIVKDINSLVVLSRA